MRAFINSSTGRFLARVVIVIVATGSFAACGAGEDKNAPLVFTSDENYLMDSYIAVRRAGSRYPAQPQLADSLLTLLTTQVDSVRIAHTISQLNQTPERWVPIFEEIEKRIRETADNEDSEQSSS